MLLCNTLAAVAMAFLPCTYDPALDPPAPFCPYALMPNPLQPWLTLPDPCTEFCICRLSLSCLYCLNPSGTHTCRGHRGGGDWDLAQRRGPHNRQLEGRQESRDGFSVMRHVQSRACCAVPSDAKREEGVP